MSKPEQILNLDPSIELRFKGPFTDVVTAELRLSNPSQKRVCFKVKTTAPKRYCVRPNSGIIEPGGKVAVAVMLQPFDYDPNEKNKHKFMVQTMVAPDGTIESQENLWKEIQSEQLMDSKLKCVFDMPDTIQNNLDTSVSKEENTKNVDAKSPTPEKIAPLPKAVNLETELRNALDQCKRLNEELHDLRRDNNKLKDEGVRLRKVAMSDTTSSTPTTTHTVAMEPSANALPPIVYLVAAVILGLILGKFIL